MRVVRAAISSAFLLAAMSVAQCKISLTLPDESALRRPCECDDMRCLQDVFVDRGWCPQPRPDRQDARAVQEQDRESVDVFVDEIPVLLSTFNITAKNKNVTITGIHNGVVTDFYFNDCTNNAVLGVTFADLVVEGVTDSLMHRNGQEDVHWVSSKVTEQYPRVETTTIFSSSGRESHASIDTLPKYSYGDDQKNITDCTVTKYLRSLMPQVGVAIVEVFDTRTSRVVDAYIRDVICRYRDDDDDDCGAAVAVAAYSFAD